MSTETFTEREFASNYLALLALSDSHEFVISSDYSVPLKSLNSVRLPTLPKLPVSKRSHDQSHVTSTQNSQSLIKAQFKSIKPPKFQVDLEFPSSLTAYEVKKLLLAELKNEEIDIESTKFLVKGKVIQDAQLISDLNTDDLKIIVMVGKTPPSSAGSAVVEAASTTSTTSTTPPPTVELPWDEISEVLQTHGFNNEALQRLQRGWSLTQ